MGFFSTPHYSTHEHHLSEPDIKKLISYTRIPTLKVSEERKIQEAIRDRRHGDGKISLQQIYEVLLRLHHQGAVSKFDKEAIMKLLQEHFAE